MKRKSIIRRYPHSAGLLLALTMFCSATGFAQGEYVLKHESAVEFGVGIVTSHGAGGVGATLGISSGWADFGISTIFADSKRSSPVFGARVRGFIKPKVERPIVFASLDGILESSNGASIAAIGPSLYLNAWTGRSSALQFSVGVHFPALLTPQYGRTLNTQYEGGISIFTPLSPLVSIAFEASVASAFEQNETASGIGIVFVFREGHYFRE